MDRQNIFEKLNDILNKKLKFKLLVMIIYIIILIGAYYILKHVKPLNLKVEIYNCITAFLIIDISATERKNLNRNDRIFFYNSISTITRAMVKGFIAPVLYVLLFGNMYGILYMLLSNFAICSNDFALTSIYNILDIVPSIIASIILYFMNTFKNKTFIFDFQGDFLRNLFFEPLLNVDIMAANLERVNFCKYYANDDLNYVKCYGKFHEKIDENHIKNYIGTEYSVTLIWFLVFFLLNMLK